MLDRARRSSLRCCWPSWSLSLVSRAGAALAAGTQVAPQAVGVALFGPYVLGVELASSCCWPDWSAPITSAGVRANAPEEEHR